MRPVLEKTLKNLNLYANLALSRDQNEASSVILGTPSIPTLSRLSANGRLWVGGSSIRPISVTKWVWMASLTINFSTMQKLEDSFESSWIIALTDRQTRRLLADRKASFHRNSTSWIRTATSCLQKALSVKKPCSVFLDPRSQRAGSHKFGAVIVVVSELVS